MLLEFDYLIFILEISLKKKWFYKQLKKISINNNNNFEKKL